MDLIVGNGKNAVTYYTDAAKISAEEDAAITLQFPDKKAALTPRRFTFIEKTSTGDGAILSIGASFDDVTIEASLRNFLCDRDFGGRHSLGISGDGSYHFSDGDYLIATKAAHSVDDLQKITVSNDGKGADLTIDNGDIVPSDGISIVNGAIEVLNSEEGGDSGGNLILELVETAFETVIEAIEDFVGESDDTVDLASVAPPDVETMGINGDTIINMNAFAMNDFEIPSIPAVINDSAGFFIETPAQEQILEEILPYTSELDAIIKKEPAVACNFDDEQAFSMSYVTLPISGASDFKLNIFGSAKAARSYEHLLPPMFNKISNADCSVAGASASTTSGSRRP